ncbi:MAG: armadillo-type protein [Benjaminiella poitrasii]|nr:MAG: armadillo-type protein [Benjaminiella poitrasii]
MEQSHYYRKFSLDPVSFHKRFDLLASTERGTTTTTGGGSRLTPSYSNPDLASSARRTSSTALATATKQPLFVDDFSDHPQLFPHHKASSSFHNNTTTHHGLYPLTSSYANVPFTPYQAAMNPLLVSHLVRQIPSQPPSPGSRKNSMTTTAAYYRPSSSSTTTTTTTNTTLNDPQQLQQQQHDRFAALRVEDVVDEIYGLCKDQYGCRFFQKKLEEQKPDQRDIIFNQIYPHFVELMIDPFGNYLCQKMMEYCTDSQRTMLIEQVSRSIMSISLNMHGTRAVQRMIEFLTLPEQIDATVEALSSNVVTLIKDINGNHIIQKCLHRLTSKDKQFIYDAVSRNCVEVATHRHGCCVLQRCIDYSAEHQKKQLVEEIIRNALTLVQDPYGNYVVQYVLELGDAEFSDNLIRQFIGHLSNLSVQKYSSNVMEKCIRVAEEDVRRDLIEEMINKTQLEKLLKDSYANYVVQTALDFAEEAQYQKLGECIRPLLPAIRNTSYCKRIQGKLNRDQRQEHYFQQQAVHYNASVIVHPLMAHHDMNFASSSSNTNGYHPLSTATTGNAFPYPL